MWKLNVLFIIAVAVTLLLMRTEIRRFRGARQTGSMDDFQRRRFTRRMFGVIILTVMISMTYFGYTNINAFRDHLLFGGFYWMACLLMAPLLIVLALLDVRAVFQEKIKEYIGEEGEAKRLEQFLAKEAGKTGSKSTQ